MKTKVTDMLGVEFPILAFSHCRDVVAAVTRAGGFGVLGAVAHTPDQLEVDLGWIEEQTHGGRYGVDLLLPANYAGAEEGGLDAEAVRQLLPPAQQEFVDDILRRYQVPELPADLHAGSGRNVLANVAAKGYEPLLEVAFAHDITLVASALGPPPPSLITRAHDAGVAVAALAGTVTHAQRHQRAGVDVIVAQGTEAGGHTGEVGTMVLVPEVVDAVAPTPCSPRAASATDVRWRRRWRSGRTACGAARCGSPPRRPRPTPRSSRSFSTPPLATPFDPGH